MNPIENRIEHMHDYYEGLALLNEYGVTPNSIKEYNILSINEDINVLRGKVAVLMRHNGFIQ